MKYTVHASVMVSCHTVVEADSVDDALRIAEERPMSALAFRACMSDPDEAWVVEELDGEARGPSRVESEPALDAPKPPV